MVLNDQPPEKKKDLLEVSTLLRLWWGEKRRPQAVGDTALWTLRTKLPLRLPALRTMEMQPIAQICCDRSPRRSNFRRRVPHPSPSPFLSLFPFSVSLPFSSPCLVPEELQQATIGGAERVFAAADPHRPQSDSSAGGGLGAAEGEFLAVSRPVHPVGISSSIGS